MVNSGYSDGMHDLLLLLKLRRILHCLRICITKLTVACFHHRRHCFCRLSDLPFHGIGAGMSTHKMCTSIVSIPKMSIPMLNCLFPYCLLYENLNNRLNCGLFLTVSALFLYVILKSLLFISLNLYKNKNLLKQPFNYST